jgi:putative DNA methylase
MTHHKKKLIEVSLPLEAINKASAREKSIRHGHPSTLHLWWARRPLAAARAVIFAQMVDDPSANPDLFPTEKAQEKERKRLFKIIEDLVQWENTTNEEVLQRARDEIWQSWRRACAENVDHPRAKELFDRHKLPAFHDPFAGGGALPLEAQRLGLEAYASDLNPVAVLINKAMIEIPPKFAGRPPVHPSTDPDSFSDSSAPAEKGERGEGFSRTWRGAQGLAEDVRYYGKWMRDEAEKRIGYLYPKIEVTAEMAKERPDLKPYVGRQLTVIAWLWARTVKSPNPAYANIDVPLASTFMLSTKPGKEAYVEPEIFPPSPPERQSKDGRGAGGEVGYRFTVKIGKPKNPEAAKNGTKLARGANFRCLMSGTPIEGDYIKAEGKAGRMGARLLAIVAEGERGRFYLPPNEMMESIAHGAKPVWKPEVVISGSTQYLGVKPYGIERFSQLFTARQLVALTTFSDLVQDAREHVHRDAIVAGMPDQGYSLESGGDGALAYSEAVAMYLAFSVDKMTDTNTCLCSWQLDPPRLRATFGRQALPMVWDYAEANIFGDAAGDYGRCVQSLAEVLERQLVLKTGWSCQMDAMTNVHDALRVISTDPPYFDNVPYADLSDFFYVWLRRSMKNVFPNLFATMVVPKVEELVAFAYRHESKEAAGAFFLSGMTQAMQRLVEHAYPSFPVTIYYAFKQSESDDDEGTVSTGWDTFLDAVIRAGFAISGTWPMRSELATRNRGRGANALASSIILVCRPRAAEAPSATRREFVSAMKAELPAAVRRLQGLSADAAGTAAVPGIAPVDLAQAAIGPGMAIYTRYARVLDAEGKPLTVRQALALINQTLDEVLAEQEGDFDADTRWALAWFEQNGFGEGKFGDAETLSKAKNTSVAGMVEAGILSSKAGRVCLLRPEELNEDWDPDTDDRMIDWEITHQLIRVLDAGGEPAAAALVAKLGVRAETARELAYRLYNLCERKKRAAEALAYNSLVQSWSEIARLARAHERPAGVQEAFL